VSLPTDPVRTTGGAPQPAPAREDGAPDSIEVAGLAAGYDGRPAIEQVSFSVEPGTLLAIFGPNGGGKSTLLKVLAGLLPPMAGSVSVLGHEPGAAARRIAYVPQAELVDWAFPVTVWDVVMMGRYPALGPLRRPGPADRKAVADALARVRMGAFGRSRIGALSGGQRRRVFLARAFAADPDLYLLDEPVTGIDATTQEDLMDLLEAEARAGKTIVATTHDLACVAQRFARVLALNGRLVAHGPAPLVLDPDVLSRTYGGHLLVLDGRTVVLDDAHHHDQAPRGERHHHEEGRS
jgi:ABC-type Mn2+/Zn2+ transport system ATPase subunit